MSQPQRSSCQPSVGTPWSFPNNLSFGRIGVVTGVTRPDNGTNMAVRPGRASHYGMTGSRSQGIGYAVGATEPRRATCERSRSMPTNLRYLGLDVHAETIAVAVAAPGGEARSLGLLPHPPAAAAQPPRKPGPPDPRWQCAQPSPCRPAPPRQLPRPA